MYVLKEYRQTNKRERRKKVKMEVKVRSKEERMVYVFL